MEHTINDVLRITTLDYLNQINISAPPAPATVEAQLLMAQRLQIQLANTNLEKGEKWKVPQRLIPWQIANIVAKLYPVCTICTGGEGSDRSYDLLAIYQTEGDQEGIYVTDDEIFSSIMRQYNITMNRHDFAEAMQVLREIVPRKERCKQAQLIAVNNGIFDYDTKQLLPFDPELVFMSKSKVNYNPNAKNITIQNPDDNTDWDVESWMNELSDDPEIVNLLWEILGAIIRPLVSWNKSAWFYSETGNNGKGTLCELMRQLCGAGSFASIPLADMGKDFMLEPLTRASAIIVDENDVGTFIDKAANLKAIITNDVIQINRKFKTPIPYKFYGFMVQCLNEFPKVKDKSDSFFRRQLFIPFTKCFTGIERRYIKNDYLHRTEVLEYVLYKVLNMNYYTLSEPDACQLALEEYKEFNDPVRQFAEEILPMASWDLLPFTMLYEMYQVWYKRNYPSGKIQSRNTFINDIIVAINNNPDWECPDRKRQLFGSGRMECTEYLLNAYDMKSWMNPHMLNMPSADVQSKCTPLPGQYTQLRFRGINRTAQAIALRNADTEDNDTEVSEEKDS